MKLLLCLVILISGFCAGASQSALLSHRVQALRELLETLKILDTEMRYSLDTLPVLLKRMGAYQKQYVSSFFSALSENIEASACTSFSSCFRKTAFEVLSDRSLKKEDLEILCLLGDELGRTDLNGQISAFERTYTRLLGQLQEAEEDKQIKGKMYRGLGAYGGILLVILLL